MSCCGARRTGLSADGVRFLEIIERNADRLFTLIDDLLMLNRLEAGGLPLELTDCSISGLAAEAVRSAQPLAAKVGVTIHLDAGDGPPTPADPRRLLQVLDNLISNAVKFSNSGGLVLVVTQVRQVNLADRRLRHRDRDTAR